MTRDELIKACIDAEVWANDGELHRVLDVAEPIIRADERREAQLDLEAGIVYRDLIRDDVLAELRAKALTLPEDAVLYRGNILDLIAGISDE